MKQNTGKYPEKVFCDKGYRGSEGVVFNAQVFIPQKKQRLKKSTKISHLKFDHRMDKNYLLGSIGDKVNEKHVASMHKRILEKFSTNADRIEMQIIETVDGLRVDAVKLITTQTYP